MNGELSDIGKKLEMEYIGILNLAGYTYIKNDNLKKYLEKDLNGLNDDEIKLINEFEENIETDTFNEDVVRRQGMEIPKYCYYFKPTDKRGDGYCITRLHPKQKELGKDWLTTKSKKVSKKEKYKQMIEYLNDKKYNPIEDVIIEKTPKKEVKQITPEDKFKLLDKQQLITIIKMKNKDKTTQEVSDYIKENFNIYINRNFISKLWLGEELNLPSDVLNSKEYQDMKLNTKKKTARKFNKEEIDWVLDLHSDKTLRERVILFKNKFGKTISKEYISKLNKSTNH
jgi:hypothetical protein